MNSFFILAGEYFRYENMYEFNYDQYYTFTEFENEYNTILLNDYNNSTDDTTKKRQLNNRFYDNFNKNKYYSIHKKIPSDQELFAFKNLSENKPDETFEQYKKRMYYQYAIKAYGQRTSPFINLSYNDIDIIVINVHFGQSQNATKRVGIINKLFDTIYNTNNVTPLPVIVAGDFNLKYSDMNTLSYTDNNGFTGIIDKKNMSVNLGKKPDIISFNNTTSIDKINCKSLQENNVTAWNMNPKPGEDKFFDRLDYVFYNEINFIEEKLCNDEYTIEQTPPILDGAPTCQPTNKFDHCPVYTIFSLNKKLK